MAKRRTPAIRETKSILSRGIEALDRDQLEEAVVLLRMAVELTPDSVDALMALGEAAARSMLLPEAIRSIQRAAVLNPSSFTAHLRLARLYARAGVPVKAGIALRRAVGLCSDSSQERLIEKFVKNHPGYASRGATKGRHRKDDNP